MEGGREGGREREGERGEGREGGSTIIQTADVFLQIPKFTAISEICLNLI